MPVMVTRIRKVLPRPVGRQHGWQGTAYDIVPESGPLVSTLSAFKAALCERACLTSRTVEIGWKDGRYGHDLVTVRLVPQEGEQVA